MDAKLSLTNKIYEVVFGNYICFKNWSVYLFDDDFKKEKELRNKIGVIWLCSLFDTAAAGAKDLPKYIIQAESKGWNVLAENTRQISKLCTMSTELLEKLTKEEQVFITDMRNQLVHGAFNNRHNDKVSVKYFISGEFKTEKISREDYAAIIRSFHDRGDLDGVLGGIIDRFLNLSETYYWRLFGLMQNNHSVVYEYLVNDYDIKITV